jgi:hypothetical protein
LGRIFAERRQTGSMDLEAMEMAFRAALHQAGAAALAQLLQFPEPAADQRLIPCPCGHQAHYRELRMRRILTVLGEVELNRPWYLCPQCHNGQFPVDRQLDVENLDCSPGVRRMQALVGQQVPFDHGREQMKLLAGLEVTAKSVERNAEGPILPNANNAKSLKPSSWICRSSSASRFPFCMCKWMEPAYQ